MRKKVQVERREHPRAKRILSIHHRLHKRRSKLIKDVWHWHLSTTENMSLGGLLFHSNVHYSVGDIIELKVVMSGVLDVFEGMAEVMRVEKKEADGNFPTAVKFLDNKALKKRNRRRR